MMTQTSFRLPKIAVWLMLFAFLCVVMVPSLAVAKKEMTIATEGDPTDGLDYSGGGGSGLQDFDQSGEPNSTTKILDIYIVLESSNYFIVLPFWNSVEFENLLILEGFKTISPGASK